MKNKKVLMFIFGAIGFNTLPVLAQNIGHSEISCNKVGIVQGIVYSDYCYDFHLRRTIKCSDSSKMKNYDPSLYSVSTEVYVYTDWGKTHSYFVKMPNNTNAPICLNSFTPGDSSGDQFIGISSKYSTQLGYFGTVKVPDNRKNVIITPTTTGGAHMGEAVVFCKTDPSPMATANDLCPND